MLNNFFHPGSVAVIGASRLPGKVGYDILNNLIQYDYQGDIYPVNPKAEEILGLKSYGSIAEVPSHIDLAIVVVPARFTLQVIKDLSEKGVNSVIIITAGFKETGIEGLRLEQEVLKVAKENGIRVLGPNCLGLIDTSSNLNASFAAAMPDKGNIAFFSQSGALCTAILDWAVGEGIGFSKFISLGNKADISEVDMLEALAADEQTKVILGYLEGIQDGRRFMEVAKEVSKKKPLIIIKSGGTSAGARAASSHTGTLAGSDKAFDAAFSQCGVIRARTIEELFDFALAFAYQPLPEDKRLAILTNAGGPGIIAADACEKSNVAIASFARETVDSLREFLPADAAFYNPVDVIGDAKADRYENGLKTLIKDDAVDGVLVILTPQAVTEREKTAEVIAEISRQTDKPILTSFMGEKTLRKSKKILNHNFIPNYPFPERAIHSFKIMADYRNWQREAAPTYLRFETDNEEVERLFADARNSHYLNFGEIRGAKILAAYGFRTPQSSLAETSADAVRFAGGIGYPVVLKIASPDILHKSDVGGVRVGLQTAEAVEDAFNEMIMKARQMVPEAVIWGTNVQEMVFGGKEIILGMSCDPQFGPMIMFGLGGIYVEVLKDVSFMIAPVSEKEARQMVDNIRSAALLRGVRGEKPMDLEAIYDAIMRLSQLVTDFPEIVEMDINPLLVLPRGEGAIASDIRLTIKGDEK